MCEKAKISRCGCIIKQRALYFKTKCTGKCTHNPTATSPHPTSKQKTASMEVKNKKSIPSDTI
jgi:hypothetical protein